MKLAGVAIPEATPTLPKREHKVHATRGDGWTVSASTVYIAGVYEAHSDGSVLKYYAAMGQTVAVRQAPDATGTQAGTLLFLLHDHLGGTVGLLDASGAVVGTQTYWPYGATRTSAGVLAAQPPATDKQYTGQRAEPGDQTLGLYNYKARFYSTVLGEFLSADSAGDGLNRYGYVGGNPIARNDPTGHRWCETDTCDPASSSSMNDYSHNTPVCSAACQLVGAWQAFHPGGAANVACKGMCLIAAHPEINWAALNQPAASALPIPSSGSATPCAGTCAQRPASSGQDHWIVSLGFGGTLCIPGCVSGSVSIVFTAHSINPAATVSLGGASGVGALIGPVLTVGRSSNGLAGFERWSSEGGICGAIVGGGCVGTTNNRSYHGFNGAAGLGFDFGLPVVPVVVQGGASYTWIP